MAKATIKAVILAYNEEDNIKRCLDAIKGWCEIYVVDSFSQDQTVAIAKSYGAHVLANKYENHASQWNWALANIPVTTDWILALDSDFIVTPELKEGIDRFLSGDEEKYNGFYVRHEYVFWGSRIRFGGIKKYWLRGIRHGKGSADSSDLVDFRFNVEGPTKRLTEKVIEDNDKDDDFTFWVGKQDIFSVRLAVEEELRRRQLLKWEGKNSLFGNTDEKFKKLRDLWLRMPLFIRPWLYFIYRYILAFGFLDGKGGFVYHFQQGLWLRMVIDMKIWEIRKQKLTDDQLIKLSQVMLQIKTGSLRVLLKEL